jgi:hypothetical protein
MEQTDLTNFLSDAKDVLLISDFEGTAPKAHFEKFTEYCTNKKVIFLGDMFDSTATVGDKNCKGDMCDNPEQPHPCKEFTDENYCALRTLKLMVENPDNCRYVVGNRDLNKIKMLPFFQFADGYKWWDQGNSYVEIVTYLLTTLNIGTNKWLYEDMEYFKPFWKLGKETDKKKWDEQKDHWNNPENIVLRKTKNINANIYDRFEAIFGKDASLGTMSAIVTLRSIPNELFPSKELREAFFKECWEKCQINLNVTNLNTCKGPYDEGKKVFKKTVRAALIITIFMRMLDKALWTDNPNGKLVTEFGALDGYLYHYLTRAKPVYYATLNKNLCFFAHGGITKQFIESSGRVAFDKLNGEILWRNALELDSLNLKGGGKPTDPINAFNESYFEILNRFLQATFSKKFTFPTNNFLKTLNVYNKNKKSDQTGEDMLILLQLSAGDGNAVIKKTEYSMNLSPIQMKEPTDQNLDDIGLNVIGQDYERIFNIFGHASAGAGYSLGLVKNSKKTYYVNTDYSTTLFKDGLGCSDYNENYLILTFNPTDFTGFKLSGTLFLIDKYKQLTISPPPDLTNTKFESFIKITKEGEKTTYSATYTTNPGLAKENMVYYIFSNPDIANNTVISNPQYESVGVGSTYSLGTTPPPKITFVDSPITFDNLKTCSEFIPPEMEKLIKFNGIVTIMNAEYCLYSTTFHTKTNMFIFIPKDVVIEPIYREFPNLVKSYKAEPPPIPAIGGRKIQHKRRHTKRKHTKRKHTKRKHTKRKHTKRHRTKRHNKRKHTKRV